MLFTILLILCLVFIGIFWFTQRSLNSSNIFIKNRGFKDLHFFITGGSKGLGKAFAIELIEKGAYVTIVARNQKELEETKMELQTRIPEKTSKDEKRVCIIAADVTNFEEIKSAVETSEREMNKPIQVGILNAGTSLPGYFIDTPISDMEKEAKLNYFGVLYTSKALADQMSKKKTPGHLLFISSTVGLFSFIGFSSYGASKFAVRGLFECLRNELTSYNIGCSIYYAGTMNTEGYEIEEKRKPQETKDIEGSLSPLAPNLAAKSVLLSLSKGEYCITTDIQSELIRSSTLSLFVPRNNFFQYLLDIFLAPFLVLLSPLIRYIVADIPVLALKKKFK